MDMRSCLIAICEIRKQNVDASAVVKREILIKISSNTSNHARYYDRSRVKVNARAENKFQI